MHRNNLVNVLIAAAALGLAATTQATTRHVCPSGCAYASIQSAINASGPGDTVVVHDGTYNESLDSMGKAITVRSENGPLTTIVDASGLGRGMSIWQGEDERTVVQGFTFTGGNASPSYGGGMAVNTASPTIRDCVITGNTAPEGGGVYLRFAAPVFRNCAIDANTATDTGGAGGVYLYGDGADAVFIDCTISDNTGTGLHAESLGAPVLSGCTVSANSGRGISTFDSDILVDDCTISNHMNQRGISFSQGAPVISNSRITNNRNVEDGGGIWSNGGVWIRDSVISGNLAKYGAGIELHHLDGPNPFIQRCLIIGNGNTSTIEGGGISISNVEARIESSTISGNWALVGAGIEIDDHPNGPVAPTIVNSTISANYAQASNHGGAGIHLSSEQATTVVKNTILWGNYARGGSGSSHEIEIENGGPLNVTYSVVAGGWTGAGNLNLDPSFVNPRPADEAPTTAGDYHLLATSDCINAATANDAAETDIDRGQRPWGMGLDIGSDEIASNGHVFLDGFESGGTEGWSTARQF